MCRLASETTYESPGSRQRQLDQFRHRLHAGVPHDRTAMVLDSALADAKIGNCVLAGLTGEDAVHDLTFSRREFAKWLAASCRQSDDLRISSSRSRTMTASRASVSCRRISVVSRSLLDVGQYRGVLLEFEYVASRTGPGPRRPPRVAWSHLQPFAASRQEAKGGHGQDTLSRSTASDTRHSLCLLPISALRLPTPRLTAILR